MGVDDQIRVVDAQIDDVRCHWACEDPANDTHGLLALDAGFVHDVLPGNHAMNDGGIAGGHNGARTLFWATTGARSSMRPPGWRR